MKWIKDKSILYALLFGVVVSFLVLEIFLRVYQPYLFSIKGDRIRLPVGQEYIIENDHPKLDRYLNNKVNSLGFRGQEIPDNFKDYLSIITVGGSTTEDFYLSNYRSWTYQLGVKLKGTYGIWINNAGLQGHSTYAHIILMEDYIVKLKPDIVLFLIGINDIGIIRLQIETTNWILRDNLDFSSLSALIVSLSNTSEVLSLIVNIYRYVVSNRNGLGVGMSTLESTHVTSQDLKRKAIALDDDVLNGYRDRVQRLVTICKDNSITPVLITQPQYHGNLGDRFAFWWTVLERYNNITRSVARLNGIQLIDLANKFPNHTHYYYDYIHLTNEGTREVSRIIHEELFKSEAD